jgi:hypothetical protein
MNNLHVERGHVSASVAAEILGVSRQRVNQLLKAGLLQGAFLMDAGDRGEVWVIPRKAVDRKVIKKVLANIRLERKRKQHEREKE